MAHVTQVSKTTLGLIVQKRLREARLFLEIHRQLLACLIIGFTVLLTGIIAVSRYTIESYNRYIVSGQTAPRTSVGLVLGAGTTRDGKPYKELQARLDTAAAAVRAGYVDKLILSGDNRFSYYDEPSDMKNYLVKIAGIAPDKLQPDYAGRSTYESCERAAKVFEVRKTIIFSAESHLPRAIYLCRHFGVEAYGISSGVEANNSTRRELVASVKALYNTHLYGEHTILGSPIPVH